MGALVDPLAAGGELAVAEIGMVEMAAGAGAALELGEVLSDAVVLGEFFAAGLEAVVEDSMLASMP